MRFGALLRKARKEVKITQSQMAELLNMSRTSVSNIENDLAELKAETLLRWSQIVGKVRTGQVSSIHELAAMTLCSIDVASVMQTIMQVIGG